MTHIGNTTMHRRAALRPHRQRESGSTASLNVLGYEKCGVQDYACKWCWDTGCKVRWREFRKQSSDRNLETSSHTNRWSDWVLDQSLLGEPFDNDAMFGGQVFLGIKRDSGSRCYRLATAVAFRKLWGVTAIPGIRRNAVEALLAQPTREVGDMEIKNAQGYKRRS